MGLFLFLNQTEADRTRIAKARHNAEIYEKFAESTAMEIGAIVISQTQNLPRGQREASVVRLHGLANEMRKQGVAPSLKLADQIGWALSVSGKSEEGRELINQSVADLRQRLVKNPKDDEARYFLRHALVQTGQLAETTGRLADALDDYEEAFGLQAKANGNDLLDLNLIHLYKRIPLLTHRLGQGGRLDQEERSRRFSEQMFHQLGSDLERSADATCPGLEMVGRLLQRDALKKMSAPENSGEVLLWPAGMARDWFAIVAGPLSPFRSSSSAATYDRDHKAGAMALISTIRELCLRFGVADSLVPSSIKVLGDDADWELEEHRRLGRVGEGRSTAARLTSLARQVVREYPGSADSCRILIAAYSRNMGTGMRLRENHVFEDAVEADRVVERVLALRVEGSDVSVLLAILIAQASPFYSSYSAATCDRDREAGANSLISAVRERCLEFGLADSLIPAMIDLIVEDGVLEAANERTVGRLDATRATAARLTVLARRLVGGIRKVAMHIAF